MRSRSRMREGRMVQDIIAVGALTANYLTYKFQEEKEKEREQYLSRAAKHPKFRWHP